jgi:hypothetical protein
MRVSLGVAGYIPDKEKVVSVFVRFFVRLPVNISKKRQNKLVYM